MTHDATMPINQKWSKILFKVKQYSHNFFQFFENSTIALHWIKVRNRYISYRTYFLIFTKVWDAYPDATFRPTIESVDVEDAFITNIPSHLPYHSPELPWMIGLTTGESAGTVSGEWNKYRWSFTQTGWFLQHHFSALLANNSKKANIVNKFYKTLFPIMLQYLWNTKEKNLNYISQIIKTHYFGEEDMGEENANEMVRVSCRTTIADV